MDTEAHVTYNETKEDLHNDTIVQNKKVLFSFKDNAINTDKFILDDEAMVLKAEHVYRINGQMNLEAAMALDSRTTVIFPLLSDKNKLKNFFHKTILFRQSTRGQDLTFSG